MTRDRLLCGSLALLLLAAAVRPEPLAKKERPAPLLNLQGHTRQVFAVQFSPDGKLLATASNDGTAGLWDSASGRKRHTLAGHVGSLTCLAFHPEGGHLATGGHDGTVRLWDTVTGRALRTLPGHDGGVYDVAYSPSGKHLVSGGGAGKLEGEAGGEVKLWEHRTKKQVAFRGQSVRVVSLAYSPDGRRVATGDASGAVSVWEPASDQAVLTLRGHQDVVFSLGFSHDGRRLASAGRDGRVTVWDLVSGKEAMILKGHKGMVGWVAFSPDGRWLASTGLHNVEQAFEHALGEVWFWDAASGAGQLALQSSEQEKGFWGLAFSPCSTRLATAHGDGTVKVWSVAQLLGQ